MFGLFSKSLPEALQHALRQVTIDDWQVPVLELATSVEYKREQLTLCLPFVADFLHDAIVHACEAAGYSLQIVIKSQNQSPFSFGRVRDVVMVASGKGGVGKSTTAVNLAVALAQQGAKVGLLDADIYGPSVPLMIAEPGHRAQSPDNQHLMPLAKYGVVWQSIGFLVDPAQATIWRGPMASGALLQLVNETLWPELDVLVIDMPPGTGDIQLTLSQKLKVSGAVIVTTPQDVALADAEKGIAMFRQVHIPVLGLIENMSFYQCPSCGHADDVFGTEGGHRLANRYGVTVLGQLPLERLIRVAGDEGAPISLQPHPTALLYKNIARRLLFTLYWQQQTGRQAVEIITTDD